MLIFSWRSQKFMPNKRLQLYRKLNFSLLNWRILLYWKVVVIIMFGETTIYVTVTKSKTLKSFSETYTTQVVTYIVDFSCVNKSYLLPQTVCIRKLFLFVSLRHTLVWEQFFRIRFSILHFIKIKTKRKKFVIKIWSAKLWHVFNWL